MKTTTNAIVKFQINRCGMKKRWFLRKSIQSITATVDWIWQGNGFDFDQANPFDPIRLEWIFQFTGNDEIECGEVHSRSWVAMEGLIDAFITDIQANIPGSEIKATYEFAYDEDSLEAIALEIKAEARENL